MNNNVKIEMECTNLIDIDDKIEFCVSGRDDSSRSVYIWNYNIEQEVLLVGKYNVDVVDPFQRNKCPAEP